jgi:hypothetical protein
MKKNTLNKSIPEIKDKKSLVVLILLITIFFILLGYITVKYFLSDNVSPFVSNYDGRRYNIRTVGTVESKQTAANYLAKVSGYTDKLVDYMYKNQLPDMDTANRLYYRWGKCLLKETSSYDNSAAYTLNKSTEIRLCIRTKNGSFEDINTSMFVILHELAHVMSIGFGHEDEFKYNFSYVTHLASNLGIYKPQNFRENPVTYCGTEINTTPCDNGTCEYNSIK